MGALTSIAPLLDTRIREEPATHIHNIACCKNPAELYTSNFSRSHHNHTDITNNYTTASTPQKNIMTSTTSSPFLALPQELRDLIYQHALRDTLPECEAFLEYRTDSLKAPIASRNDTGGLVINYQTQCPRPAWYTLLLCCKPTNKDICELVQTTALKQKSNIPQAVVDLRLSSTTSTAIWQSVPCHPRQISSTLR